MRQLMTQELPLDREVGASVCRGSGGEILMGSFATGHASGVQIPLTCPAGTDLIGTWHTHPSTQGFPGHLQPSRADWAMTRKHGLDVVCITQPELGQTRCWPAV